MSTAMKLSEREAKALRALANYYNHDGNHLCFAAIAEEAQMPIKQVRRTVRALARKGLAQYGRGLFTAEGDMAGSGYCCTAAGYAAANANAA